MVVVVPHAFNQASTPSNLRWLPASTWQGVASASISDQSVHSYSTWQEGSRFALTLLTQSEILHVVLLAIKRVVDATNRHNSIILSVNQLHTHTHTPAYYLSIPSQLQLIQEEAVIIRKLTVILVSVRCREMACAQIKFHANGVFIFGIGMSQGSTELCRFPVCYSRIMKSAG